jgi:hypothetical protein
LVESWKIDTLVRFRWIASSTTIAAWMPSFAANRKM